MFKGLVINSQKNKFRVKTSSNIFLCDVKGSLIKKNQNIKNFLVVGDEVIFEQIDNERGVIYEIEKRKSEFYRKGIGSDSKQKQIIASNVDQGIIIASIRNPTYKANLIDRYVVALKTGNIEPIVCFNKIDLDNYSKIQEDIENYLKKGIKVVVTSTFTKEGIDELKMLLKNKISVFSGVSGAGKSSLINAIIGENTAVTSEVSSYVDKGKHTTTSSTIYELENGGMIIDTPGMKEFGLFETEAKDNFIEDSFSDILEIAKNCRYRNCNHIKEPNCAIKEALENGEISERNVKSYLKLKNSEKSWNGIARPRNNGIIQKELDISDL